MKLTTVASTTTQSNINVSRPTAFLMFCFTLAAVPGSKSAAVSAINTIANFIKVNINHATRSTDIIKNLTLREIMYFAIQKGALILCDQDKVTITLPLSYGKTYMFNADDKLEIEITNASAVSLDVLYTTSHHAGNNCCQPRPYNNISTNLYRFERNTVPAGKFQDFPNDRYTSICMPTIAAIEVKTKDAETDKYSKDEMDIINSTTQQASAAILGQYYTNYENEFILDMSNVAKIGIDNDTISNQSVYMIRQIS